MKKCTNPGCSAAPTADNNKFCTVCGSPLTEIFVSENQVSEELSQTTTTPKPVVQFQTTVEHKKSKSLIAFIAVLISLIVILTSVIAVILLKPIFFEDSYSENETVEIAQSVDSDIIDIQDSEKSDVQDTAKVDEQDSIVNTNDLQPEKENLAEPETVVLERSIEPLYSDIVQVDSANFPNVSIYVNILDDNGVIPKNLELNDFEIYEIDYFGRTVPAEISALRQIIVSDSVSVNLVLDISGSMRDENKMGQAQYAASLFLSQLGGSTNDLVEITAFDDYVYVPESFTNNYSALTSSIYNLSPGGQTALNDAIYSALLKTNLQKGAKCVIVFTDGLENRSSYTYNDVITLAQATGIPLYIIGIGQECDEAGLTALAKMTRGWYYSTETSNLGDALAQIYSEIYTMQREWYRVEYISKLEEDLQLVRQIKFAAKKGSPYLGESEREYIPEPIINQSFADKYKNQDYILNFTSTRPVTQSDLAGLSLAELRIARNEIFARYGRQFKDPLLNKWFYSKFWYLAIMTKYSPADFDKMSTPLSKTEQDNTATILEYEQYIMNHERIFPQGSLVKLTEYDLSLSKPILTRGLEEIYSFAGASKVDKTRLNDVERYNVELIESALQQAEITY